jgi:cytochrome bd ubiquinol oxidase subunit I
MNTAGWMLTENGRQPWIVQGLMKTANGVSPSVSATDIWISLIVFYALFIAFGVADAWLMIRYGRKELDHDPIARLVSHADPEDGANPTDDEPALVY